MPQPTVVDGPRLGFRHRARLAVRGRIHNPKIGIFELGSHRVVHIPDCRIHHPLINEVAAATRRTMVEQRVSPYSDLAHAGSLRYLQIVVERQSASAQLVVVTRDETPAALQPFFDALRARLGARLHSLWWNGHPERNNSVLGELWQHLSGPDAVSENGTGAQLYYPPGAFGQSNLELADTIAARVGAYVPDGASVMEFYAGVGALGLPLASRVRRLDLNEINEASLAGLTRGLGALPEQARARIGVHAGSAGSAAEHLAGAEVVIVDPPRKGLDAQLLAQLLETPAQRLIYVSCGLPALLREAEQLLDSRKYQLSALEAFALFPYSEHVETLAVFDALEPRAGAPGTMPA